MREVGHVSSQEYWGKGYVVRRARTAARLDWITCMCGSALPPEVAEHWPLELWRSIVLVVLAILCTISEIRLFAVIHRRCWRHV